jgi:pyridinium-3,5-bisthiocarboxylic acid mononucleotide nickel chelatase
VDGQPVAVKVGHRGGGVVQATPEFGDVEALAAGGGRPVRDVLVEADAAAVAAGLVAGAALPHGLRADPGRTPA